MKNHKYILERLSSNDFPSQIDDKNFHLMKIFRELYEQNYVAAIDASANCGDCFLDPHITISGRKLLQELSQPEIVASPSISIGNITGGAIQFGSGNSLNISIGIQDLVEGIASSNDLEAKLSVKELLNNATVASLIGAGVTSLLALL